ncbi:MULTISPECIES: LCP family protein [Clostridium]|jgi:LCP family protein required for cell wall assembly|uniref:LCP family protein n=1 Tax=Clostridium TaxID=1485 RepID=UPI000E484CFF|nr:MULTISPECIES: LCP family protein [Clostridium]RHQ26730.1 LytR family transcriptional regulator [Clostridium sp. AF27-5AA]
MGYEEERDRSGHRRSRRAKPSEMEDDGLTLITDSFTERREDGSHRSGDRSRSGQKATKRGQTQPGSSRESRNQEKTRTMNRSDIYADPVKLKARRKKKRKIWFILLEIAVLIGILCFAGYSYISSRLDLMQRLPWNPDEIKNVEISEEKQEQMSGYWTIAVFGVDSRNSSVGKGNNSDVNILCNIDQGTGEIRLVSVYRDSYLNISDKNTYNKINAAYMQGGPEQVVKALNRNLDIDIDDYATFNWKAVADAINILGGIDVEITKSEFYYINAFISETVKATGVASTQLKSAGMNHLDGVQAVAYGRLRLMDTDYARTERQRKVISLAFEKMKKADWATINNIVQTVFPQVATSIEINDLLKIGRNITRYHLTETTGFPSELREKKMGRKGACVIPQTLESNVIELHHFLFGDEEYTPTETVRTISQKIVSDTGVHGTKQAETKALPKTTEATTISILDPTQESGADESQEAGSGSDESEKETGNASETQENDASEQESRTDGTHASKENARESESGGSSPAFPGGNSGTDTENGREKPSGSGSPNGSSAPGSKTDAGIIIE